MAKSNFFSPKNKKEGRAMDHEKQRKHIFFYGDVQGVGFRYHAKYGAQGLGLTGWVKNCCDGSVEMEVQGWEEDIDKLIQLLHQDRYIRIQRIEAKSLPLREEERGFQIRGY